MEDYLIGKAQYLQATSHSQLTISRVRDYVRGVVFRAIPSCFNVSLKACGGAVNGLSFAGGDIDLSISFADIAMVESVALAAVATGLRNGNSLLSGDILDDLHRTIYIIAKHDLGNRYEQDPMSYLDAPLINRDVAKENADAEAARERGETEKEDYSWLDGEKEAAEREAAAGEAQCGPRVSDRGLPLVPIGPGGTASRYAPGGESAGGPGPADQPLLQLRHQARQSLILLALAMIFEPCEVSRLVSRARVPVLKLRLKYDTVKGRVIPGRETAAKLRSGKLQAYDSDVEEIKIPPTAGRPRKAVKGTQDPRSSLPPPPPAVVSIDVDICLDNDLPVRNTELLGVYADADKFVRPLILLVKYWARQRGISDSRAGFLNSYTYAILVIFYLQQTCPAILPVLQRSQPREMVRRYSTAFDGLGPGWDHYNFRRMWRARANLGLISGGVTIRPSAKALTSVPTLSQLLVGFFRFYAYQINWSESVISIRLGRALDRAEKGWFVEDLEKERSADMSTLQALEVPPQGFDLRWAVQRLQREIRARVSSSEEMDRKLTRACLGELPDLLERPGLKYQSHYLCIEDPFETDVDLGRYLNAQTAALLGKEFRRAYCVLRRSNHPVDWLFLSCQVDPPGGKKDDIVSLIREEEARMRRSDITVGVTVPVRKHFAFSDTSAPDEPDAQGGSERRGEQGGPDAQPQERSSARPAAQSPSPPVLSTAQLEKPMAASKGTTAQQCENSDTPGNGASATAGLHTPVRPPPLPPSQRAPGRGQRGPAGQAGDSARRNRGRNPRPRKPYVQTRGPPRGQQGQEGQVQDVPGFPGPQGPRGSRESQGRQVQVVQLAQQGTRDVRDVRDVREVREVRDAGDTRDAREAGDPHDTQGTHNPTTTAGRKVTVTLAH